jgi:hypothetical protein
MPSAGGDAARIARFEDTWQSVADVTGETGARPTNDWGALAWGTAWVMRGLLVMHEATGDPAYLHRLGVVVDWVLDQRDDVRGVLDQAGRRAPAWSSAGIYSVHTGTVPDGDGRTALLVHVGPPAARGWVDVEPGASADRFRVRVTTPDGPQRQLDDLSLDRHSPRFAPRVAYAAYTHRQDPVLEVPAPGAVERSLPSPGRYPLVPARVVLAAQTGMIAAPIAGLVRVVRADPVLAGGRLGEQAERWEGAAEAALAVHDDEWRDDGEGRSCYVLPADQPLPFAGVELPTNEFLAMGLAHLELAAISPDPVHRDRAEAMARTFRQQLRPVADHVVWSYWPDFGAVYRGWSKSDDPTAAPSPLRPMFPATTRAEDITHALIDVEFAFRYRTATWVPPVFTDPDMNRLARTYVEAVAIPAQPWRPWRRAAREPGLRRLVAGSGASCTDAQLPFASAWLALARWDPRVRPHVLAVQRRTAGATRRSGVDAYCAALLVRG